MIRATYQLKVPGAAKAVLSLEMDLETWERFAGQLDATGPYPSWKVRGMIMELVLAAKGHFERTYNPDQE